MTDEKNLSTFEEGSEDFAAMFAAQEAGTVRLQPGQKVTGTIITITGDSVFVDVGIKLDGIMDQYLWDTTDHGKVLLSDVKGKTLHIDQGAWATYMESRQGVDDIDHVIAQIKTTLHLLD